MFDSKTYDFVQEEFALIKDVCYVNTALCSIPPKSVLQAYDYEMKRFVETYGSEDSWNEEMAQARKGIAAMINAKESEIALLSNTVEGISMMAKDYPWDKDKKIALFEREHASNRFPWAVNAEKGLFKLHPICCEGSLSTEDVLKALEDPEVQALTLSQVQYTDGAMVDMEKIGAVCQEKGILFIVDAIQAIGRMVIDVEKMHIDFLSAGCHKGFLVRNGIGFVYCSDKVFKKLYPTNTAYQSTTNPPKDVKVDAFHPYWHNDARRLENGNRCHQGVYALCAASSLFAKLGVENVAKQIVYLHDILKENMGEDWKQVLPSCGKPSGIVRVDFPAEKRDEVVAITEKNKVICTIRPNNVRFCINFFNTEKQMEILANTMKEILKL